MKIVAAKKILKANDQLAAANRRLFRETGVFVVNVLGSPGGGKTALIEKLAAELGDSRSVAVIEGDLAGTIDADRLAQVGLPVVQITTEGACHLDANMVAAAVQDLPLPHGGWLFIENVGNLVCPASFDLGEELRIVLLSVPEGDDKVIKYPTIFQSVQAVVISKADLLPHFEFQPQRVRESLSRLNPQAQVFEVSVKTGLGIRELVSWLISTRAKIFGERPNQS